MTYELTTLGVSGKDATLWADLLNRQQSDIYFTPQYLALFKEKNAPFADRFGAEPELIWYGDDENYILYPILKRSINILPFVQGSPLVEDGRELYDVVSPWYYGGPLPYIDDEIADAERRHKLLSGFFSAFHEYCTEHNMLTEFVRLHPLLENHNIVAPYQSVEEKNRIVYVNLYQDAETIWQNYKQENRKSINRASRRGVTVQVSRKNSDILAFYHLYTEAMDRLNAAAGYYFTADFFSKLFAELGERAQLFLAYYEDELIAGSILIGMDGLAHDYLRAFDPAYSSLVPNNLVVHEKITWAKEHGYRIFSLQGGHSPNDGIFRFKLTFSKDTAPFYVFSHIHDTELYRRMSEARDKYYSENDHSAGNNSYFPYYRR